jgi:broad specificity phosphatase PhoE
MPNIQRIHLVRHGQTVGASTAYVGDPPLTPLGERQAEHASEELVARGVTSMITSPLFRAQQTALPLVGVIGSSARVVPGIREIELGDYPGDKVVGRERPMIDFGEWGGDHGADFSRQAIEGFEQVLAETRADRHADIAVVSHGGTINVILDHIAGIPWDGEMRHLLANCGISTLEVGADSVSIVEANVVKHLPEDVITR